MKLNQHILLNPKWFLFFSISLFFSITGLLGQKKIEIVQANVLKYNRNIDPELRKLIGDVILRHNFTLMYCDSAYFYQNQNHCKAFGNIKIIQGDSLNLTCDSLNYDGNTYIAAARTNVVFVNKDMTLHTDILDYNTNTSSAYYYQGGKIINQEMDLTSIKGQYNANSKTFKFKDSVIVINPQYIINSDTLEYNSSSKIVYFLGPTVITSDENYVYCEYGWYNSVDSISQFEKNAFLKNDDQIIYGDLLYFNEKKDIGKGRNNVKLYDFKKDIIAEGHKFDFSRNTEVFTITDSAVLVLIENDSLFIHADTIKSEIETDTSGENRLLKAYHNTRFYRNDLQGKCDSMVYSSTDSIIKMFTEPVIWSGENQMTSDYVEAYIVNKMFDRVYMKNNAFIIMLADTAKFNQVKGREMMCYFNNNQLYKIDVEGNGQSIYFIDEAGEYIGMNKVECSNLVLHIENKKIKKINTINKPKANLTPIEQVQRENMKLRGFVWHEGERPLTKEGIFTEK